MHGGAGDRFAGDRTTLDLTLARPQPREQAEHQIAQPDRESAYLFLVDAGVSTSALAVAELEAQRIGAFAHEILLSAGVLAPHAYAAALARRLGVVATDWEVRIDIQPTGEFDVANTGGLSASIEGHPCLVLCAEDGSPNVIADRVATAKAQGLTTVLCSRLRFNAAMDELQREQRLYDAVERLYRQQPAASAAGPIWLWQVVCAAVVVGLIIGGFSTVPDATLATMTGAIALPFLFATVLRIAAFYEVVARPKHPAGTPSTHTQASSLPVYSVLVPLFREANVVPGLVQSLMALSYPRAKLDILLVLEAADVETQAALAAMSLPGNFRVVIVPDRAPRTKPKALNYALQLARGEYVVVYDAEDRPEPDQLLRALEMFSCGSPKLGCVQAQLNIYNPRTSWFSRGILAQTPQEVNPA